METAGFKLRAPAPEVGGLPIGCHASIFYQFMSPVSPVFHTVVTVNETR